MTPVHGETMKLSQDLPLGAVSPRPGGSFAKGFGHWQGSLLLKRREDKTIFD